MCTASHYNVTYVYTLYIITGIVRGRIQIGNVTRGKVCNTFIHVHVYTFLCVQEGYTQTKTNALPMYNTTRNVYILYHGYRW